MKKILILCMMLFMVSAAWSQKKYEDTGVTVRWRLYDPPNEASKSVTHFVLFRMQNDSTASGVIAQNIPVSDTEYHFYEQADSSILMVAMKAVTPDVMSDYSNAPWAQLPKIPMVSDTTIYPPFVQEIILDIDIPPITGNISASIAFTSGDKYILTIITNSRQEIKFIKILSEDSKFFDSASGWGTVEELDSNNDRGSPTLTTATPFNIMNSPIIITGDMDGGVSWQFTGHMDVEMVSGEKGTSRFEYKSGVYLAEVSF